MSLTPRNATSGEKLPYVELLYALLYLPLFIGGTVFVAWYELARKAVANGHTAADSVYAIIIDIGYVGVADAAITFGVVEGGVALMVLARRWLERMEQQGKEAGKAIMQRRWEAWNNRRLQAQGEGREFNEPPPSLYDEGD